MQLVLVAHIVCVLVAFVGVAPWAIGYAIRGRGAAHGCLASAVVAFALAGVLCGLAAATGRAPGHGKYGLALLMLLLAQMLVGLYAYPGLRHGGDVTRASHEERGRRSLTRIVFDAHRVMGFVLVLVLAPAQLLNGLVVVLRLDERSGALVAASHMSVAHALALAALLYGFAGARGGALIGTNRFATDTFTMLALENGAWSLVGAGLVLYGAATVARAAMAFGAIMALSGLCVVVYLRRRARAKGRVSMVVMRGAFVSLTAALAGAVLLTYESEAQLATGFNGCVVASLWLAAMSRMLRRFRVLAVLLALTAVAVAARQKGVVELDAGTLYAVPVVLALWAGGLGYAALWWRMFGEYVQSTPPYQPLEEPH